LVPVPPLAELRSQIEQIEQLRVIGLSALPGVREWIESAERLGMGLAVASSSPLAWVQARLEDVRLDSHFTVMSCRGDQLAAKPEPDLYLDACRRLGVDPTRSIAVEDSANGLAAAHAAGLVCVAVPNTVTRSHDLSTAELLVESLAAVPFEEALRLLSEKRGL
jgi:putative hydrolase of the HAD superfamily